MPNAVITRFSPSPTSVTGGLHIGGARTALYNFLLAKKNNGIFKVFIEDTDEKRSTNDSLIAILKDMVWLGLIWNEGPSLDLSLNPKENQIGNHGPYFQSQRLDIYNKYIDKLLSSDHAYEKDGAIFFRMPKETISFDDMILGTVSLPKEAVDNKDFVIRKSSGMASFYFSNAIDNALNEYSHILRCNEHISTTFRQIPILKALGFKDCFFGHMPLVMNIDGSKMSKRQKTGQVNVCDFRKDGYLPEVLLNYVALCGCGFNGKEIMTLDEMIENFDVSNIGKTNARFDYKKLDNFNATRISKMSADELIIRINEWAEYSGNTKLENNSNIKYIIDLCKSRSKTLKDLHDHVDYLTCHTVKMTESVATEVAKSKKILAEAAKSINRINEWSKEVIMHNLQEFMTSNELKPGVIFPPLRMALFGRIVTPPIDESIFILGKKKAVERLSA